MPSGPLAPASLTKKFFDRRDRLLKDGVQFVNTESPHDVVLYIDIPYSLVDQSYGQVCTAIRDRMAYRLALSSFKDPGCLPFHDKARMKLTYELNDLPNHEGKHTTELLYRRILEHLESRTHIKVPFHRYVEENKWQNLYEALVVEQWTQP